MNFKSDLLAIISQIACVFQCVLVIYNIKTIERNLHRVTNKV